MKAEEELRQMAIAHDLFCELNPKSKDTAISILRLLLVEETRPFLQSTPPTIADVSKRQKPMTSHKKERLYLMWAFIIIFSIGSKIYDSY